MAKSKLNHDIGSLLETPRYYECYSALANNRIIFISEDISKSTAAELSAMLLYYDEVNEAEDINIYINTNGGDAAALSQIFDIMQIIHAPIKTICFGKAYSAGAYMLSAGTKGKRLMTRNSSVMIHGIQANLPPADQKKSEIYFNFLKDHNRKILEILAKNTGRTVEQIEKDCEKDLYMDAEEAVKYGIVDDII